MKTKIDRTKIYYKVTSEEYNHNDYESKCNVNVITEPFTLFPVKNCIFGGIYFCESQDLVRYFYIGDTIRPIRIPEDAQIIKIETGEYVADKVIFLPKISKEEYFKVIWNPDIFNWKEHSIYLVSECSKYFKLWWNKDKFDYQKRSNLLASHCFDYFEEWWNSGKFNWEKGSKSLAIFCNNYFKVWWNPNKFNWEKGGDALQVYCNDYRYIWEKDLKEKFKK